MSAVGRDEGASTALYRRAQALFDELVERGETERNVALQDIQDSALRRVLAELLDAHTDATLHSADDPHTDLLAAFLEDEVPETLGAFAVVRKLGDGGMGVVYEAIQDVPRRHVALKALASRRHSPDAVARFRREIQTMVEVVHPGIPQVYEVFEVDGLPVVAMELVEGRSLRQHGAGLDWSAKLALLIRLVEIVAFAVSRRTTARKWKFARALVTRELGVQEPS